MRDEEERRREKGGRSRLLSCKISFYRTVRGRVPQSRLLFMALQPRGSQLFPAACYQRRVLLSLSLSVRRHFLCTRLGPAIDSFRRPDDAAPHVNRQLRRHLQRAAEWADREQTAL